VAPLILLDANLLVYAYTPESPRRQAAGTWLEEILEGPGKVGLPWPTLLAFARLMGNPNVVSKPIPVNQAWAQVETWIALPKTWIPLPTDRHHTIIGRLLSEESRPDLATDAHLAALAIEHGLTVCSTDGDFARFRDVRWENPLAGGGGNA
jgi:toxin-antitoxin system PIN domain toxin